MQDKKRMFAKCFLQMFTFIHECKRALFFVKTLNFICYFVLCNNNVLQVENLTKGSSYLFRVSCQNKVGMSLPAELHSPIIAKPQFGWSSSMLILNISFRIDVNLLQF